MGLSAQFPTSSTKGNRRCLLPGVSVLTPEIFTREFVRALLSKHSSSRSLWHPVNAKHDHKIIICAGVLTNFHIDGQVAYW